MSRCLLHKNKLEALKEWLTATGIEHRPARGDFQVLQVKVKSGWQCIFDRLDAKEHYTVALPLESIVRRFINAHKGPIMTDHNARQAGLTERIRAVKQLCAEIKQSLDILDKRNGVCGATEAINDKADAIVAVLAAHSADARNGEGVALAQEMRWRDVSVEKPTQAQQVLFVRNGKVHFGAWINDIFWYSNEKVCALYWMPLPEAPTLVAPAAPAPKCSECKGTGVSDGRDGALIPCLACKPAPAPAAQADIPMAGQYMPKNSDDWKAGFNACRDMAIARQQSAIPPECTCPSGNGSLRHPCPVHAAEPTPDTGWAEADAIIGRLMSSDPGFDDCADAAAFIRRIYDEHLRGPDGYATWKAAAIAERTKRLAGRVDGRIPYLPYLTDRADGVKGHYCITRWVPERQVVEHWNLRRHHWAAFSDDVLTMEQAVSLLKAIVIPTATPADAASEADPKPGEIWHVILKGASSVFTAKVNEVTPATVLLQKPNDYYETRYVRADVRFVECAVQRERQQGADRG